MPKSKVLKIYVLIPLLMLAIGSFVSSCKSNTEGDASALKALGLQSAIVLESKGFSALREAISASAWHEDFHEDPNWKDFLGTWEPLFGKVDTLNEVLKSKRVFCGVELVGKNSYGWLLSTDLKEEHWNRVVAKWKLESEGYDQFVLYSTKNADQTLYVSWSKGVVLLSPHKVLLESGLRRLHSTHTLDLDEAFSKIRATSNNRDHANIYVQYTELDGWLSSLMNVGSADFLSGVSTWGALDLRISSKSVLLTGLSNLGDSIPVYLDVFRGLKPQKIQSADFVPVSAALWMNVSVGNFMSYHRNFEQYRKSKGLTKNVQSLLAQYDVDFENAFLRLLDREYGLIWTGASTSTKERSVAYFEIRSERDFFEAHKIMLDTSSLQVFRGERIFRTKHYGWLSPLMGKTFDSFQAKYFWMYRNRVFYAATDDILTDFINDVLDERTLGHSAGFKKFASQIPDRASVQFIFMPEAEMISHVLPKSAQQFLKRQKEMRSHTPYISLQYLVQDKMAYTGIFAAYQTEVETTVKPVWSAEIPHDIVAGPFIFTNHYNQQKEIAVQDSRHTLYYYTTNGSLLWKRTLSSRIIGTPTQVDLFRNSKLQIAFATKEEIVVLDRNGDPVAPFPKKINGGITSPLAVFDYDRTRNYRLVFASGKKVFNWDKEGQAVQGWALQELSDTLRIVPQHWVAGNKDYLVFVTENRKAYLTDRRGVLRVPAVLDLPSDNSSDYQVQIDSELKTIKLTALTNDGRLLSVLSNGKVDELKMGSLPDLPDLRIMGEALIVFSEQKCLVKDPLQPMEIRTDSDISGNPKLFGEGDSRLLALATTNNQIMVYNNKAQLIAGFPVYGTENFQLAKLYNGPSRYLITTTPENKILVYLIQ